MKKPELLAPAGDKECFETALRFGADAVYIGGTSFGLRAFADNFDENAMREAVDLAHGLGKRVYVTVNALMREEELGPLSEYLQTLASIGPDAVIFSDPAVLMLAKGLPLEMHLSTQASTMNSAACRFWTNQGVRRIVLAREATLEQIRALKRNVSSDLEIEVFVHGAMCIAHSGRCLMSAVMAERSGNRGECAQPCRWEYEVREKGTDDLFYPVREDERGTYVFNSRDLAMLDRIPDLINAGIDSFKIEGRMKSAYYVASVVHAYRRAIDMYLQKGAVPGNEILEELGKSASRLFTHGFFFGEPGNDGQDTKRDMPQRRYTFCAKVIEAAGAGYIKIEQRNKFSVGEQLEVLSPYADGQRFCLTDLRTVDGIQRADAPHAQETLLAACPLPLRGGEFLRRLDSLNGS